MHAFKLLRTFLKINLQMAMAYRADTIVNILINVMWLGWELIGLSIIFSNTDTLGGWGPGELISLLGVFRLVHMLMFAVIWPATEKFNTSVRDGSLDYTLLQPANSLYLVTISRIVPWRIWEMVMAGVLIVVGISISGSAPGLLSFVYFVALMAAGMMVIYSLWIVLIALTFWFVKFDNNVTILQALLDSGRYPATVYPPWLRLIVTYLVPIAVATTIPLQGLRGDLDGGRVLVYIGVALTAFFVATRVWKAGVKQYSGASS
jgi:ABC-2 type transport system permease protein